MRLHLFFAPEEVFKELPDKGRVYVSPFTGKMVLVVECGLELKIKRFIRYLQLVFAASLVAAWLLGRFVGLNILLMSAPPFFVVLMSYIYEQRFIKQLKEIRFKESAEVVNAFRAIKLMAIYLFAIVMIVYLVADVVHGAQSVDLLWPFVMLLAALSAINIVHVNGSNFKSVDVSKVRSPTLDKKFKLIKLIFLIVFLVLDFEFIFSMSPVLVKLRESIAHSGEVAVYAFLITVVFIFPWEILVSLVKR